MTMAKNMMGYTPADDGVTTERLSTVLERGDAVLLYRPSAKLTIAVPASWATVELEDPIEDFDWADRIE
jgi:hypothetical protein